MRNRAITPILIVVTLLSASLACNFGQATETPDLRDPDPTFKMPTDGSTLAPVTVVVLTPGPWVFTAGAVKLDFSSDGISCEVPTTVKMVVNPDNTVELSTTGPNITDHYNCKATGDETWYLNGIGDDFSQTAGFQTCNFGNFAADGAITYANQSLLGAVSCLNKDGTKAVTLRVGGY